MNILFRFLIEHWVLTSLVFLMILVWLALSLLGMVFIRERQVGIIVHRSASYSNVGLLKQSVEACLGSLDVSNDAKNKKGQYKRAR